MYNDGILSLALLVTRILTHDTPHALANDDTTIFATALEGGLDFHIGLCCERW